MAKFSTQTSAKSICPTTALHSQVAPAARKPPGLSDDAQVDMAPVVPRKGERNERVVEARWQFTTAGARVKLPRRYRRPHTWRGVNSPRRAPPRALRQSTPSPPAVRNYRAL